MKRIFLLVSVMLLATGAFAQHVAQDGNEYRLKKIIPVAGRQGIAADGKYYYNTSSTGIYKYDKEGKLVKQNLEPFKGLELKSNHFGDIDVHNGEIFTGIEWFEDGVGKNIQIAVYDANTLQFKYSIPFDPSSGQVEVSGLTIDPERNVVWMSDWVDGKYLYRYDLDTRKYAGKVHLRPAPQWQQGIYYSDGKILITSDDGDADLHETDNIYVVDVADYGKTAAPVKLFREMKEFKRAGEIEGLAIDPEDDALLVLTNRGSKIVLGMVKGFYDGYDKEIHELYIFEKIRD